MLTELREIKKLQKKPDGIFGSFMTRPVSHIVAYIGHKIGLSPNLISFVSFILCSISSVLLFFLYNDYKWLVVSAIIWWLAAIFDAADGDLARYAKKASAFGGWFDSLLDRMKEFLIFFIFGYIAFKQYSNELYLVMGFISIFTNVMSGWISDTKKLFIEKRQVEIGLSKNYSFGMVDTRDFFVILSLMVNELRLALLMYSSIFVIVLLYQIIIFFNRYKNI